MQNRKEALQKLQDKIGYQFQDIALLKQALTHSSFANEQKINKLENYERLEFLGDAVLELVSSEFLFHENKDMPEGQLTKLRASMVCEPSLAYCAKDIGLGKYILLGRGEEATGGRNRDSIISDVMEAVIGAVFLDGGIEYAKKFIFQFILSDLENKILFMDSKTLLQEEVQKDNTAQLRYELVKENLGYCPGNQGRKTAIEEVEVADLDEYIKKVIGTGVGKTKKAAEQQAAYEALIKLKGKKK